MGRLSCCCFHTNSLSSFNQPAPVSIICALPKAPISPRGWYCSEISTPLCLSAGFALYWLIRVALSSYCRWFSFRFSNSSFILSNSSFLKAFSIMRLNSAGIASNSDFTYTTNKYHHLLDTFKAQSVGACYLPVYRRIRYPSPVQRWQQVVCPQLSSILRIKHRSLRLLAQFSTRVLGLTASSIGQN